MSQPLDAERRPGEIRIQFNRGCPTTIAVRWPVAAAADCGQWLREETR